MEDLAAHDCVGIGNLDSWKFESDKGRVEVPARVVVRYRTVAGVANAVAAGIGLAPLPVIYFSDPVLKNVLTPILPEYPLRQPILYAIYVSRRHIPLKIRIFIDHLMESRSANVSD